MEIRNDRSRSHKPARRRMRPMVGLETLLEDRSMAGSMMGLTLDGIAPESSTQRASQTVQRRRAPQTSSDASRASAASSVTILPRPNLAADAAPSVGAVPVVVALSAARRSDFSPVIAFASMTTQPATSTGRGSTPNPLRSNGGASQPVARGAGGSSPMAQGASSPLASASGSGGTSQSGAVGGTAFGGMGSAGGASSGSGGGSATDPGGLTHPNLVPGLFPLQSGGSVGPVTTYAPVVTGNSNQSVPVNGTVVSSGVDSVGIYYTISRTFSATTTTITTTGGGGNWTYEEDFSYSYDATTTPANSSGISGHDWGTSSYSYIVGGNPTSTHFTLLAAKDDHSTGSQSVTKVNGDGSTDSYNWSWHDDSHNDRTITGTADLVAGTASGTDVGSGWGMNAYTGTGTYTRNNNSPSYSESINGTLYDTGTDAFSYGFNTSATRSASGAVEYSGTDTQSHSGSTSMSSSGSGSYSKTSTTPGANDSDSGTLSESDANSNVFQYNATERLNADGSWTSTGGSGSGSASGSQLPIFHVTRYRP